MSANDNLPGGYDNWRTHNPDDDQWGDLTDAECTCGRSFMSRRYCPVHGVDPDTLYDLWRDRQMEKDE